MIGKKFKIIKSDLIGEITGLAPAGQPFNINTGDREWYYVSFKGFKGIVDSLLFKAIFDIESDVVETKQEYIEEKIVVKSRRKGVR